MLSDPAPVPCPKDASLAGIPAEALRQRPDIREAERRMVTPKERIEQLKALNDEPVDTSDIPELIGRRRPGGHGDRQRVVLVGGRQRVRQLHGRHGEPEGVDHAPGHGRWAPPPC